MKTALIFGITGQDGSYMADILLGRGYRVYGVVRRGTGNRRNVEHLKRFEREDRLVLIDGDLTDSGSVKSAVVRATLDDLEHPVEIYNFADQDSVGASFNLPQLSVDVTFGGAMNVFEAAREIKNRVRVFQPASATMFGPGASIPQTEETSLNPQSPYAVAKAAAYHLARYYRRTHGLWVSTAILYNHDSPRRARDYLLQKIVSKALNFREQQNWRESFVFEWNGDLGQVVEVGSAVDYVEAIHAMIQLPESDDFVICQGSAGPERAVTIRLLIEIVCYEVGLNSVRIVARDGPKHRPGNPETLVGDYSKAARAFGYAPKTTLRELIRSIIKAREMERERSW